MFYFVPSWYNPHRIWYSATTAFYQDDQSNRRFDDAVNLLRMFQQTNQETTAVVFNYAPHLRAFLYAQQLDINQVYNIFDEFQNVSRITSRKIGVQDLGFPAQSELYYTPYLLNVYVNQVFYARVNFTHWGDIYDVTYYHDDKREKTLIFDDRGFVSSVIYYEWNEPNYQEYLNKNGEWVIREYLAVDNHMVEVNSKYQFLFKQSQYHDMTSLMDEKITGYLHRISQQKNTSIMVSSDMQHNHYFESVKQSAKVFFSFFGERYDLTQVENMCNTLRDTPFFVIDSVKRLEKVASALSSVSLPSFYEMPPYNTQLVLGQSQRKKEQIIYLNFDSVSLDNLGDVLYHLFSLMMENEWYDLVIATNKPDYGKLEYMKDLAQQMLNLHSEWVQTLQIVDKTKKEPDVMVGGLKPPRPRIEFIVNHTELELIESLKYARIVVDLGDPADVLLQINALSVGIPQVNLYESSYVKHMENGWILQDVMQLVEAIRYYFEHLEHWNEALVYAVSRMEMYASGEIVEKLMHTLEEMEVNHEED